MKFNHTTLLTAVLSFGLVLTSALMFISFNYLVKTQQQVFDKQSQHMAMKFEDELKEVREEINSITTTFYALNRIQSDTLRIHSEHTFAQYPAVKKMIFAQRVTEQQRPGFEAVKHEDGFISFHFYDFNNTLAEPARHPSYLPIIQIEPFNVDTVSLLGANLSGNSNFSQHITHAIKTGDEVSLITSLGDETIGLWLFKAIYSGYSGRSDPYFTKHSNEMVNGIIGLKSDIKAFLHHDNNSVIKIKLSVQNNATDANNIPIFQRNWQEKNPSIWSGLSFANQYSFPLSNQLIILQTGQTLSWFNQTFLLFLLSGCIGLGFTALLVYSTLIMLESERRNRAILEAALDAIISIDEQGLIQEFNPAAELMFGYQSKQVIGQGAAESLIPRQQRQQYKTDMAHYLTTNEQHLFGKQLEFLALKADGETISVEVNIVEVITGKRRLFTAFVRDISIRKKAQYELAQLATVVKQSFNAIIITDVQGVIQYVNPAFEKMSGFQAAEALGQRPNIIKSGEHSKRYYASMWKTIKAGNTWTNAFINRNKNGQLYHVEQTISPLCIDNECVGYTSVQQDVTERNRLQAQSEHTQRLESLGVLAGGIAHDFNNLLSIIMGNTGLAQSKLGSQHSATQQLDNIQNATSSAATLCQQMLAYSGQGHFIIQPLNLSSIIADIMQLLESSISKLAKLDIQLNHNLPAINADEGQMKQVIMNLVINASEAIGEHSGNIHISTTQCHLHQNDLANLLGSEDLATGDYIHLQIRDDGCGMDSSILKRIFDPFFTTKFTGRGLGMSAILGIIRGHSGGLKVTSKPQQGTNFDIYFPVSQASYQSQSLPATEEQPTSLQQGLVLVVDDEELLREIAQCILEEVGITVLHAEDGVKALELLQQNPRSIDLVLLDMTMPNMGGEACYQNMRKFAPDLDVIICSGYAELEVREHFDNNHIDFLQKPYLPEQLINKVQDMLTHSRGTASRSD